MSAIFFGWISDLTRNRRVWTAFGLIMSCVTLNLFRWAENFGQILSLIIFWQLGLNMMLAPLTAWAGDCVPDQQKGFLGGLMSIAPAMGSITGVFVTLPGFAASDMRLTIVSILVLSFVLPLLLFGKAAPAQTFQTNRAKTHDLMPINKPVVQMWVARLIVQVTEATLFAFLFLWLRSIDPMAKDVFSASVFSGALILAIPLSLMVGRWIDRSNDAILPLAIAPLLAAVGLLAMAFAPVIKFAVVGYMVFGISIALFLSLHAAQTLNILPRPHRRGLDLGLFNLTNTLPSMIMPWLTLVFVPLFGFAGLFMVLSVLSAIASMILVSLRAATRRGNL
ncbi:MAG: MFS transporter [Sphingorhabdus sp.]